jgi:hypothetical protein
MEIKIMNDSMIEIDEISQAVSPNSNGSVYHLSAYEREMIAKARESIKAGRFYTEEEVYLMDKALGYED